MDKGKDEKSVGEQKGGDNMVDVNIKRPCAILESIEESLKQIQEVKQGKRQFKSLKESRVLWKQWVKETEDESNR